jgi:hypothetical protein
MKRSKKKNIAENITLYGECRSYIKVTYTACQRLPGDSALAKSCSPFSVRLQISGKSLALTLEMSIRGEVGLDIEIGRVLTVLGVTTQSELTSRSPLTGRGRGCGRECRLSSFHPGAVLFSVMVTPGFGVVGSAATSIAGESIATLLSGSS